MAVKDAETLPLYNFNQKETVKDVVINPELVNSGSTYNRMVRKLLDGAQSLENYVDDVLGHTVDWISHKEMLRDFFERVRKANFVT